MDEDKYIEWKESWRDKHLKWICGFANAQDGVLEIGRNDKGEAIGIRNISELLKDLPNKVRDILWIVPEIDQIKEKGKSLIQIKIKSYIHPVNYKGQFYYRSGSTNQELRDSALHHFLLKKMGKTWDSISVEKRSVSVKFQNRLFRSLTRYQNLFCFFKCKGFLSLAQVNRGLIK